MQSIDGFGFDPEILFIAQKLGLRLLEVPVIWNDVPGSKVGNYAVQSMKMTADLLQIRMNDIRGRYDEAKALNLQANVK